MALAKTRSGEANSKGKHMGNWIGVLLLFGLAGMWCWQGALVLRLRTMVTTVISAVYFLISLLAVYAGLYVLEPRLVRWVNPFLPYIGLAFLFAIMLAFFSMAWFFISNSYDLRDAGGRPGYPVLYSLVFMVAGLIVACALIGIGAEVLDGNLPDFSR